MIEIVTLLFFFFIMKFILVDTVHKDQKETREAGIALAFCLTLLLGCFMNIMKSSVNVC